MTMVIFHSYVKLPEGTGICWSQTAAFVSQQSLLVILSGQGCRPLVWSRAAIPKMTMENHWTPSRLWDILRYFEIFWDILRNFEIFWDILRYFEIFESSFHTFSVQSPLTFETRHRLPLSPGTVQHMHWLLNLCVDWGVKPLRRAAWHFWISVEVFNKCNQKKYRIIHWHYLHRSYCYMVNGFFMSIVLLHMFWIYSNNYFL